METMLVKVLGHSWGLRRELKLVKPWGDCLDLEFLQRWDETWEYMLVKW